MPNGDKESQTGIEDISGDLKNILETARVDLIGNISDSPDGVSRDVAYTRKLQELFPEFQGNNVYNTKYKILNNEDGALDKVATHLLTMRAKGDSELQKKITENEEAYSVAYNRVKRHVKKNLLSTSITGESIGSSIVNRKLELYNRPTKNKGSLSYRNNNPLNIMSNRISDTLAGDLDKEGITFKHSEHTTEDGRLAKFDSYREGFNAAKVAIKNRYTNATVDAMMKKWSNGGYDGSILDDSDLANKKISQLDDNQLEKVMRKMQQQEGWSEEVVAQRSVPVEEYKEYIQENPERYQEFGIVDEEGNLIFGGLDDENRGLESLVSNNDKLHKKLIQDRYRDFEEALNNENNVPNEMQGHPSFKAQAYAVYDKFGSEGLTKFINIIQQDELKETSPQRLREALEWYRNNDVGRVRQRFMGRGKNRIEFTPPKSTLDAVAKVPADANEFGAIKYKFDKENKKFVEKSDDQLVKDLMKKYDAVPQEDVGDVVEGAISSVTSTPITGLPNPFKSFQAFTSLISNLDYFTGDEKEYVDQFEKDLKNFEESGLVYETGYTVLLNNIINKHRKDGSIDSLIRTLQSNGKSAGDGKWIINYDEADRMTKIAGDALNQSDDYGHLVYPDKNGNIVLDLKRRERISETVNQIAKGNVRRTGAYEWKLNEETNRWEREFDNNVGAEVINILNTLHFGALQGLDRHLIGPFMEHSSNFFKSLGDLTGLETADEISNYIDFASNSDLIEGLEAMKVSTFGGQTDLTWVENGGFLNKTTANIVPFAQVIGSIYLKGRVGLGGLNALANYASKATKVGKSMSALGASKYLKGNKFQTLLNRWNQAQQNRKFWTYGGTFYLGDAIEEATMPKNRTMMNYATRGLDWALDKYAGMETDFNQDYRTVNGITRTGLDMLFSFGIASAFDNLLVGPARYIKDKGAIKLGRKIPTLEIDQAGKQVKKQLDKPQFRTDFTEFYHGITKDLDKWAMGDAESAMLRDLYKSAKTPDQENLTVAVRNMLKDMNQYIDDDLKGTIEETVLHYDQMFGGKLSVDDINEIVDQRYNDFLRKLGNSMYDLFSKANKDVPESLPLKIADRLENAGIVLKQTFDDNGNLVFDVEKANSLVNRAPFRTKKRVREGYIVKDIKQNNWAIDLASRIRDRARDQGVDGALREENKIMEGMSEKEREAKRAIWNFLYGRKITTEDGKTAYINGLSRKNGFTAVSEGGEQLDEVKINNASDAPEDVQQYIERRNPVKFDEEEGPVTRDEIARDKKETFKQEEPEQVIVNKPVKDETIENKKRELNVYLKPDEKEKPASVEDYIADTSSGPLSDPTLKETTEELNDLYRKAWDDPESYVKSRAGEYYYRKGDNLFKIEKNADGKWTSVELKGKIEVTEEYNTRKAARRATDRVVESFQKSGNNATLDETDEILEGVDKKNRIQEALDGMAQMEISKKVQENVRKFVAMYRMAADAEEADAGFKGVYENKSRNTYGYNENNQDFLASKRESGRKSVKMVPKAARNIGVDDERTINLVRTTKSGSEKRVIGKKNRAPVREWDPEEAKGGIPRDVLVKKTNSDGNTRYFLSNKKTEREPSKWVMTNNGIRLNPDWDMVGKNQTFKEDGTIQRYVREEIDGVPMYRKPKEDETGDTILNIQNPTRDVDKLSDEEVIRRDIDAYSREVQGEKYYIPVREKDQAINPDDVLKDRKRHAVESTKSNVDNRKEVILENVEQAGFGKGIGRAFMGGIAGSLYDEWFGGEDSFTGGYGTEIGAALGFALGFKRITKPIGDVFYKSGRRSANEFERVYKWAQKMEKDPELEKFENVFDPAGDTRIKEYRTWFESLAKGIQHAALFGKNISESLTHNRYVQSIFSELEQIKEVEGVKALRKLLLNIDHTPDDIESNLAISFNKAMRSIADQVDEDSPFAKYKDNDAYNDLEDQMIRFVDNYIKENRLGQIKVGNDKIRTSKIKDRDKVRFFSEHIWRIMNNGAKLTDDGRYIRGATANTEHIYKEATNPQQLERIDKRLLQDEYWGTFTKSMRDWFEEIKDEWTTLLADNMNKTIATIDQEYVQLAKRLKNTSRTLDEFKKSLSDEDLKLFDEARISGEKGDFGMERLVQLKKVKDKFDDKGRAYLPQIFSRRKLQEEEARFIEDYLKNVEGATEKEAKNAFKKKMMNDWMNLNNRKPSILQEYSVDDEQVKVWKANTREEAVAKFRNTIKGSAHIGADTRKDLLTGNMVDEFIQPVTERVRTGEGEFEEVTRYTLEVPEFIEKEYGNVLADPNNKAYQDFFDIVTTGALVKNSNFLENQRKFVIPQYLAEDNIQSVIFKYKQDVGRKLHFARNGVFLEEDMSKEFLGKIRLGLKEHYANAADPEKEVERHMSRIEDIYRQQTGIVHELKAHQKPGKRREIMERKIKHAHMVGSIRNVIGMGYVYGISFYDIFQHAIMSPLLTSWGSWGRAMKVVSETGAANRMNDVGKSLMYSNQKLRTFMPEIGSFVHGNPESKWGSVYRTTRNWLGFAGEQSMTRALGNMTGWFNVKDFGAWRMLADGFYGVNQSATSINGLAHLAEAEELAKIWKQIQREGGPVRKGLKTYTKGDVRRGLEQVGIFADEIDDFVAKNDQINQFIDGLSKKNDRGLTLDDFDPDQHKYIRRILQTATDSYHGRNKMFRPESWNTPMGRLVGQYSFYPMNFSLQTLQRRIRFPIKEWNQKYGQYMKDQDYPVWKMVMDLNTKKGVKRLKNQFDDDELASKAIQEFPLDAYRTMLKVLPAGGLTFAMTVNKEGAEDLAWFMYNEVKGLVTGEDPDYEAFEKTKKNFTMNPWSAEKHQKTVGEFIDDPEWRDIWKVTGWLGAIYADMGIAGKYGNAVFRDSRFRGNSPLDLSPVGREVKDIYNMTLQPFGELFREGPTAAIETSTKSLYDIFTRKVPFLGSSSVIRSKGKEAIFNIEEERRGSSIQFRSEDRFGGEQRFNSDGIRFDNQ